jgi:glycosyltransferase involved in cell wall biosynthesis
VSLTDERESQQFSIREGDARTFTAAPAARECAVVRVSVVVPARNEARNLPHVFACIPGNVHEVILVDGHSTDDTIETARRCWPDVVVVSQTRKGKGNALACGFAAVTGDVVVMLDADGSADPAEIPAFVRALIDGADFAKGTRFAVGGSSQDITRFRRFGNAGLNGLVNVLFGTRYTDLCYGYNAFWTHMLPTLELPAVTQDGLGPTDMLWGDGFEIETLINVRVASAGARIREVGSVELERIHGVSNLNAVSDGLRVLRTIVHERRLHHGQKHGRRARLVDVRPTEAKVSEAPAVVQRVIDLRESVLGEGVVTPPAADHSGAMG